MKFIILTDVEGATGVTTYAQAEDTQFGRDMLMNDLMAVIDEINDEIGNEIIIYDEHMDGRNIDLMKIPDNVKVYCGKPLEIDVWEKEAPIDGMIMVGFHAMAGTGNTLLPHTYMREHKSIYINNLLVGEIGAEATISGAFGTPLILVTGDLGAEFEAKKLIPDVETAVVKVGLGESEGLCYGAALNKKNIQKATRRALYKCKTGNTVLLKTKSPVDVKIEIEPSDYLEKLKAVAGDYFINENTMFINGETMKEAWRTVLNVQQQALS